MQLQQGLGSVLAGEIGVGGTQRRLHHTAGVAEDNARAFLQRMKENGKQYHFVEVMACPGGCIGGGGQPKDL
ncbi:[Fe-Fe] hydrogenase large subunit C-terminal domain-containing protein, partial [Gemmiger formicilis]|uniref:[Fe-Fe] hydrogenase large subunit C-terminal domain-containing protein n=1 Tax=Gemmiger formicilis TaxID=745368 RepID=UPI003D31175C